MKLIKICFFGASLTFGACQNPHPEGEKLYKVHCANCHMDDGKGLEGLIPPLANSDYLQKKPQELACLIRHGYEGKMTINGQIYEGKMPANKALSVVEIANILNYISNTWGNKREFIPQKTIQSAIDSCQ